MYLKRREAGFTIVELMIATAVFSIVLIIVTAGIISFSHQYYQGITRTNTQNVARQVVTEISQTMQFSDGTVGTPMISPGGGIQGVCLAGKPYYYVLGKQLGGTDGSSTQHVLVTSDDGCTGTAQNINVSNLSTLGESNTHELLGKHMRLTDFDVAPQPSGGIRITVGIAYGDSDVLCNVTAGACNPPLPSVNQFPTGNTSTISCKPNSGTAFCAHTLLTSQVVHRL